MLDCQKAIFSLPDDVTYLNCSYFSPFFKESEAAGLKAYDAKRLPHLVAGEDFFKPTQELRATYSELIGANDPDRIAVIPSASYGIATVVKNIHLSEDDEILVVDEQFPSNYYAWEKAAQKAKAKIITAGPGEQLEGRGAAWNQTILDRINSNTKVVAMPHVHWADGTKFDLVAIRKKTKAVDALLIIDGSQSVGALPFDVQTIQPDALICCGYKWLMGAYGLGLAYYGPFFDGGEPIEENWQNRLESHRFENLVNYQSQYEPKAQRYNMGESSAFLTRPILHAGIKQLNAWTPAGIQAYCKSLIDPFLSQLAALGCWIEDEAFRGQHMFGIRLPESVSMEALSKVFAEKQVKVSIRGNAVRISLHLYNDAADLETLVACLKVAMA